MLLDLVLFRKMFPNYCDYMIPMWSDWKENPRELTLSVAVPGYEKEDFELFVEDNSLQLKINSTKNQLLYSIVDSLFASKYDLDSAKAEYRNGVLKVTIPKTVKEKPKQISIKVS